MMFKRKIIKYCVVSQSAILLLISYPAYAISYSCVGGNATDCLTGNSDVNSILNIIKIGINFLAAGVGVLATTMLIYGGIQYITSNGNPQSITAAKQKITNVVIGVIAFAFLYALIQWLIPGGIFS